MRTGPEPPRHQTRKCVATIERIPETEITIRSRVDTTLVASQVSVGKNFDRRRETRDQCYDLFEFAGITVFDELSEPLDAIVDARCLQYGVFPGFVKSEILHHLPRPLALLRCKQAT